MVMSFLRKKRVYKMRWRYAPAMMVLAVALASCTPVLSRDLIAQGTREFSPAQLVQTPEMFKDRLYIFGGVIVDTKLREDGSEIEGIFVPVDRWGHLKDPAEYHGRFIAIYPRSRGVLDPMVYRTGRQVTLAADFSGVRKGTIDQMEYSYPVFIVRQLYLWDRYAEYPGYYYGPYYPYYYPYYPYYYPYPYYYNPWMWPYPY
jgi:outer membrane lipoprotein